MRAVSIYAPYRSQAWPSQHKQLMVEDDDAYDQPGLWPTDLPNGMGQFNHSYATLPRDRRG